MDYGDKRGYYRCATRNAETFFQSRERQNKVRRIVLLTSKPGRQLLHDTAIPSTAEDTDLAWQSESAGSTGRESMTAPTYRIRVFRCDVGLSLLEYCGQQRASQLA
jgi:hypothetical protein